MNDQLIHLGIGGFVVVAVLQTVQIFVPFIANKNGRGNQGNKMARQIEELHDWHKLEDEDGVKRWYVPRGLEGSIERLADNIESQTTVLNGLKRRFDELKA